MEKILGVIPARFASTRFQGKPLVDILGKPMIQHVWERSIQSKKVHEWIVATDNIDIFNTVNGFGGRSIMTSENLFSGTDRCKETLDLLGNSYDFVINVQGDEPLVETEQIDSLVQSIVNSPGADVSTLVKLNNNWDDFQNPNRVKCIRNIGGDALYFSRSPIPFGCTKETFNGFWKHLGMYAYSSYFLNDLDNLENSDLEVMESLEQLKWINNGKRIITIETKYETPSVDTPSDLLEIIKRLRGI